MQHWHESHLDGLPEGLRLLLRGLANGGVHDEDDQIRLHRAGHLQANKQKTVSTYPLANGSVPGV